MLFVKRMYACMFACIYICYECKTCDHALPSEAGYVNHVKFHVVSKAHIISINLPPRTLDHTSLICNKVCKFAPELKKHMVVHKDTIQQPDPINPSEKSDSVSHIQFRSCNSSSGLKSHLIAHARNS